MDSNFVKGGVNSMKAGVAPIRLPWPVDYVPV